MFSTQFQIHTKPYNMLHFKSIQTVLVRFGHLWFLMRKTEKRKKTSHLKLKVLKPVLTFGDTNISVYLAGA